MGIGFLFIRSSVRNLHSYVEDSNLRSLIVEILISLPKIQNLTTLVMVDSKSTRSAKVDVRSTPAAEASRNPPPSP